MFVGLFFSRWVGNFMKKMVNSITSNTVKGTVTNAKKELLDCILDSIAIGVPQKFLKRE